MSKRAVITGITGQDGSYLAEFLLEKGYEVVGMVRHASTPNLWRIEHLLDRVQLRHADLLDQLSMIRVIEEVHPHEFYNLAAMSFVPASWDQPMLTGEFNALGVTRILDAIREVDTSIRFYQASSSEMFGKVREVPQTEATPFYPRSPYGVAKGFGHHITVNYRESYDLFAVSGILFNHESPRRGLEFVTRKVSDGVARIKCGLTDSHSLYIHRNIATLVIYLVILGYIQINDTVRFYLGKISGTPEYTISNSGSSPTSAGDFTSTIFMNFNFQNAG